MTQENRELLLKDLAARLRYGVYCQIRYKCKNKVIEECKQLDGVFFNNTECLFRSESGAEYSADYKPYLRPMSSMTEEEREEFNEVGGAVYYNPQNDTWVISSFFTPEAYDWLNENAFDYRGLIPMGLALEATESMYKEK